MARIVFSPFGRGSTSFGRTHLTAAYTNFYNLFNTTKLSDDNFADNAGLSELLFEFDKSDQGHSHVDGSLGRGVVKHNNIDFAAAPVGSSGRRTQWVLSQINGTVMVFGTSGLWNRAGSRFSKIVHFSEGTMTPGVFMQNTTPIVLTTLATYETLDTFSYYRIIVEEVSSTYFKYRYETDDATAAKSVFLFYLAIGSAPGYISKPGGF